jgi:acyl carrier protein
VNTESLYDSLVTLLRSHSPELHDGSVTPQPDSQLADLGIDSLELLSLAVDMENEYDMTIDDSMLTPARTVSDLVRAIAHAHQQAQE